MPTSMPYHDTSYDDEEQDPYQRPGGGADQQYRGTTATAPAQQRFTGPEQNGRTPGADARPLTFAELQAGGRARPPMPPRPPIAGPPIVDTRAGPPVGYTATGPGTILSETFNPTTTPSTVDPTTTDPTTTDPTTDVPGIDVQGLIEHNVTAPTTQPVRDASRELLLRLLSNPSPYDNAAMNAEFQNLAGGIDADYDTRQRDLTNSFARRGLYGSQGKDFASGRASDTEIGRRSAKTQLATNLATKRATTYSDYVRNALDAARAGASEEDQSTLDRLRALTQFGDTAFNHDLETNRVNQGQADDWEEYLRRLLSAGYGE